MVQERGNATVETQGIGAVNKVPSPSLSSGPPTSSRTSNQPVFGPLLPPFIPTRSNISKPPLYQEVRCPAFVGIDAEYTTVFSYDTESNDEVKDTEGRASEVSSLR